MAAAVGRGLRMKAPRNLPLRPGHPERVCWGCDRFCAADDMACGNGTDRAQHPIEIFGPDWPEVGNLAPFPALPDPEAQRTVK